MTPATVALLEKVQRRPDVARARSRLVRFGAPDLGYALARITASNMVAALIEEIGARLDASQVPTRAWLRRRLLLARYRRVTFLDLFEGWAVLTVEAHQAAAAVATSGRPARHGRPATPSLASQE